jgi:hypothetical protein
MRDLIGFAHGLLGSVARLKTAHVVKRHRLDANDFVNGVPLSSGIDKGRRPGVPPIGHAWFYFRE